MGIDDSVQRAVDEAVGHKCGLVGYKVANGKMTQAIAVDGRMILLIDFSKGRSRYVPIRVDEVKACMEDTGYAWTGEARNLMDPFLG